MVAICLEGGAGGACGQVSLVCLLSVLLSELAGSAADALLRPACPEERLKFGKQINKPS